jgi:solute carrier family 12 sodium/potassium/chloride transporter 2
VAEALDADGLHLAVLTALRLRRSWRGTLRVYGLAATEGDVTATRRWLAHLADGARIPEEVSLDVMVGELGRCLANAPQSDLDLLGLPPDPTVAELRLRVEQSRSACLFLSDSGHESALA